MHSYYHYYIGLDDKNSTTIKTLCLKCLLLRSQGMGVDKYSGKGGA